MSLTLDSLQTFGTPTSSSKILSQSDIYQI